MPTLTVVGNCQAESLRRLLSSTGEFDSQRIAPVHELEKSDMAWFTDRLRHTDVLVTQPIRDRYRGLPVGTSEMIRHLPRGARHVVVPVLRYDGLMPYQAIIRDPDDPSLNPPVVPYHDLRILVAAARGSETPAGGPVSAEQLRRVAAMSVEQIRSRERRHGSVEVSSYLDTSPVWHTVNHPDNETLAVLASGVLDALGCMAPVTLPGYEMLDELDAPIDAAAAAALGVADPGRRSWTRRGTGEVDSAEIEAEQLDFYHQRPRLVAHGMVRHADRIAALGLAA
ncbi:hypothetical protein CAPI_02955 [Corynebacterium capitovis DSM 44611]|uniref:WcbI family polysaccharide biosynthesis putative acetyltransferase n=1 Tax=Corynebacterium capitovis TaxID=131081 RepID=UPI00035C7EF9|nr:WcbI family polysaccharide biosynthesis putative acetyltransferase [Corynebacterium capitovis]WKD57155.1 hypothetical protein CAPI_02955 [Corynebacterium capitovis DSM 44611]